MGDSAFAPDGTELIADEEGVYRLDGMGYLLGEKGRESKFLQGKPMMRPRFNAATDALVDFGEAWPPSGPVVEGRVPAPTEAEVIGELFRQVCLRLNETIGGMEGMMMAGSLLAYAAAPEIFAKYQAFPGLWVHGEASSGKSTLIGWLMSLWGFNQHKGFGLLSNTSTVGLQMLLEQYSNLPVWLDEFRDFQVDPFKLGMIRSCCYRDEPAKFKVEREIRTAFIVSGESTTQDAATRGRFPHAQVATSRRQVNHMAWFQAHEKYFFLITREVLRRRAEFIGLVMGALERWMVDPALDDEVNERAKLIHGISAAAWYGTVGLLQSHSAQEMGEFRRFMLEYTRSAAYDVKSEFNVNIFWTELVNAFEAGALELKYFKAEAIGVAAHPPHRLNQGRWTRWQLFIWPEPVIAALQIFLTKGRGALPLKRKDLRDQLSRNEYWLPGLHTKRFSSGATAKAWGFDLDSTPLGYQLVADDDPAYLAFRDNESEGDPRRGPLFGIVHALEQAQRGVGRT
jgi:hypothetical protein